MAKRTLQRKAPKLLHGNLSYTLSGTLSQINSSQQKTPSLKPRSQPSRTSSASSLTVSTNSFARHLMLTNFQNQRTFSLQQPQQVASTLASSFFKSWHRAFHRPIFLSCSLATSCGHGSTTSPRRTAGCTRLQSKWYALSHLSGRNCPLTAYARA